MSELNKQLDVHNKFVSDNQPADAKLKCANITADLLAETAMAWHLEAVGSAACAAPATRRRWRSPRSSTTRSSTTFKQEDFAKFEFPRIVKEDWPTIFKIKYAMADLLYFQKDWAKCGPAFDAVVAEDPHGPDGARGRVRVGALLPEHLHRAHKDGSDAKGSGNLPGGEEEGDGQGAPTKAKFAPKDFTDNQKGMLTAFNRYVCYIKPPAGDKEAKEQLRRGEVRPRPHLLRGPALGGGRARPSATSR